jgi:ketol-acid reductoisomerase
MNNQIESKVFPVDTIELAGTTEQVVRGGRDKFSLLPRALADIKQIGVIGWGSQGPAQAQNLRDSLAGTGIKVKVGLQQGSSSCIKARAAGFTESDGTLGEMFEVIRESDLVIILIADSAQIEHRKEIFDNMKAGSTLGFSHGFLQGYMESHGESFPRNINVIGVCPKGMGPSVRKLYVQGKEVNGAGINCSFAVEQDCFGDATDIALAWAIAIGAPYVFGTTLGMEWRSDLFGERGILLGGVHGIVEAFYRYLRDKNYDGKAAFVMSVGNITGPISRTISTKGIRGLYSDLNDAGREVFQRVYSVAYRPFYELLLEIYEEVASGNEIRSVELAGQRLKTYPMGEIDGTLMWKIGKEVRAERIDELEMVHPVTAGLYCAAMMAQIDVLQAHGHCWSEIANESVIEAVDSLNPFMHARGVAHMIDNCSTTARLGARKWAPRFDYVAMQQIFTVISNDSAISGALIAAFESHPIHDALAVCSKMRPPVSIAVE